LLHLPIQLLLKNCLRFPSLAFLCLRSKLGLADLLSEDVILFKLFINCRFYIAWFQCFLKFRPCCSPQKIQTLQSYIAYAETMLSVLLESTVTVDERLKRKRKESRRKVYEARKNTKLIRCRAAEKRERLRKIHIPLQLICEHLPKFLHPEDVLSLSTVCKGTIKVARNYDIAAIGKKSLHQLAASSFHPDNVRLLSLGNALHRRCGICLKQFTGTFCTRYLNASLYAHEHCVLKSFINIEEVKATYSLEESDFPSSLVVHNLRLPRKHYSYGQGRAFSDHWVWKSCCDMVPLKETMEWVLYHDNDVREKVHSYFLRTTYTAQFLTPAQACIRREFLLSIREELRQSCFIDGVMYPTRVQLAKKLSKQIDIFGDFFSAVTKPIGPCLEDAHKKVLALCVRVYDLVEALKKMQAIHDYIVQKEGLDCDSLLLTSVLQSSSTKVVALKYLSSCLNIDGFQGVSVNAVVEAWKKGVWNQVRVARVKKLLDNNKLRWIVYLRFKSIVGDYLSAWKPETTYNDIQCYVESIFQSCEFKSSKVKLPSAKELNIITKFRNMSDEEFSKLFGFEADESLSVTKKTIRLLKAAEEVVERMDHFESEYRCCLSNQVMIF